MIDGWMLLAFGIVFLSIGLSVGVWLRGLITRDSTADVVPTPPPPEQIPPTVRPSNDVVRLTQPEPTSDAPEAVAEAAAISTEPTVEPPPPVTISAQPALEPIRIPDPKPAYRIILLDNDGSTLEAQITRRAYRVFHDGHGWDHQSEDGQGRWVYVRTHAPSADHVRSGVRG